MKYTYLLVDLGCLFIPLIASFYPKHSFYKQWKYFFPANLIVAFLFIIWDMIFTQQGVWGFNPDYLTGIKVYNLPIEEILFFICIPYCCVFTFFAMKYLLKKSPLENIDQTLKLLFLLISMTFVFLGFGRDYTFYTGLFTAIFIMVMLWKKIPMDLTFLTYLIIIPFFLLSNGLLTGSFTEAPVVWYNDSENFGLRIFTIPIEDTIYGFLMIAGNIHLYEWVRRLRS